MFDVMLFNILVYYKELQVPTINDDGEIVMTLFRLTCIIVHQDSPLHYYALSRPDEKSALFVQNDCQTLQGPYTWEETNLLASGTSTRGRTSATLFLYTRLGKHGTEPNHHEGESQSIMICSNCFLILTYSSYYCR